MKRQRKKQGRPKTSAVTGEKKKSKRAAEKARETAEDEEADTMAAAAATAAAAAVAEEEERWQGLLMKNEEVVDEHMSWGGLWLPFWDVEYVGRNYGVLFNDVLWDDDIWNLKTVMDVPKAL